MALDPAALITQAEQDAANELRLIVNDKRESLDAAERNLDQFVRDRLTDDVGCLLDLMGDGSLKPVSQCTFYEGVSPKAFAERKREQRNKGAHMPDSPPPAATAGVRAQARALHSNRQKGQEKYGEAGHALNGRLNQLMRRHGCSVDRCCDVYGDGLEKPLNECTWPEGVVLFRGRLIAQVPS